MSMRYTRETGPPSGGMGTTGFVMGVGACGMAYGMYKMFEMLQDLQVINQRSSL